MCVDGPPALVTSTRTAEVFTGSKVASQLRDCASLTAATVVQVFGSVPDTCTRASRMPSLPGASPNRATALARCGPNSFSVIHCGAASPGATEATHFVPRLPSTARAAPYRPPGSPSIDDAATSSTAIRRSPLAVQWAGMSSTRPWARAVPDSKSNSTHAWGRRVIARFLVADAESYTPPLAQELEPRGTAAKIGGSSHARANSLEVDRPESQLPCG